MERILTGVYGVQAWDPLGVQAAAHQFAIESYKFSLQKKATLFMFSKVHHVRTRATSLSNSWVSDSGRNGAFQFLSSGCREGRIWKEAQECIWGWWYEISSLWLDTCVISMHVSRYIIQGTLTKLPIKLLKIINWGWKDSTRIKVLVNSCLLQESDLGSSFQHQSTEHNKIGPWAQNQK